MKLSELHYVELLYETRQSIAAKDVNLVYYFKDIERHLAAGEEAVKKVAELEKLNDKYRQDTQDNYGDLRGTIKFRKKPIVNEAIRWTGDNLREIIDFTGLHPSAQKWTWEEYEEVVKREGLKIFTLEGPLFASVGDYIMRGVNGEFYPIKPDILAKTYDRVG